MQKLSIAMLCLALAPSLTYASGYIGLSSGIMVNTSDDFEIPYLSDKKAINYRQVPLTVFAGVGVDMHSSFYLAGEIFVTPLIGELDSSSWGDYLKMTHNYGLSILPGVNVGDHTLAYARLGWIGAHFENQHHNANGGQLGLGLKTSITQSLDLRAEYSISTYYLDNHRLVVRAIPFYSSSTINSDQFTFGLIYRFT